MPRDESSHDARPGAADRGIDDGGAQARGAESSHEAVEQGFARERRGPPVDNAAPGSQEEEASVRADRASRDRLRHLSGSSLGALLRGPEHLPH